MRLPCLVYLGSSPRVWGQVTERRQEIKVKRIIPTRMGTRLPQASPNAFRGDHPHAYGDKTSSLLRAFTVQGSSPRVWGQESVLENCNCLLGIIPTRMGTSVYRVIFCRNRWDHPHAYGDKTKEIKENSGFAKSTA